MTRHLILIVAFHLRRQSNFFLIFAKLIRMKNLIEVVMLEVYVLVINENKL